MKRRAMIAICAISAVLIAAIMLAVRTPMPMNSSTDPTIQSLEEPTPAPTSPVPASTAPTVGAVALEAALGDHFLIPVRLGQYQTAEADIASNVVELAAFATAEERLRFLGARADDNGIALRAVRSGVTVVTVTTLSDEGVTGITAYTITVE